MTWTPSIVGGSATAADRPFAVATDRAGALFGRSPCRRQRMSAQLSVAPMSPSIPCRRASIADSGALAIASMIGRARPSTAPSRRRCRTRPGGVTAGDYRDALLDDDVLCAPERGEAASTASWWSTRRCTVALFAAVPDASDLARSCAGQQRRASTVSIGRARRTDGVGDRAHLLDPGRRGGTGQE